MLLPEVGSRALTRWAERPSETDAWQKIQQARYEYRVERDAERIVIRVLLRDALGITGTFAASDRLF